MRKKEIVAKLQKLKNIYEALKSSNKTKMHKSNSDADKYICSGCVTAYTIIIDDLTELLEEIK